MKFGFCFCLVFKLIVLCTDICQSFFQGCQKGILCLVGTHAQPNTHMLVFYYMLGFCSTNTYILCLTLHLQKVS